MKEKEKVLRTGTQKLIKIMKVILYIVLPLCLIGLIMSIILWRWLPPSAALVYGANVFTALVLLGIVKQREAILKHFKSKKE